MALSWYTGAKKGWFEETAKCNGNMKYSIYIPPSGVNSNTQIHVFSCNPHDYGKGWLTYVKQKQAENPNCIFMVIPSIQDGTKGAADLFASRLIDITKEYNIPSTNINMYNWSNGNKGSSGLASALNSKGYTIGKYVSVFGIFEGNQITGFINKFETGKSSSYPYIFIDDGSTGSSYLKNNCKDYIVIKVNNPDSHSFYVADNKFNLIDFFLNGEKFAGNVTITRYVNGVAQKMSYDEFVTLMNTSSIEALKEKYSELNDFSKYFDGGPGDTLASNLAYVSNSMSEIQSHLTEHKDINYTASSSGEAKIISSLYTAANYYGSVTNVLYGNLAAETNAVYGIANAIYKLDNCASLIAETSLSDGVKTLFSSSNPSVKSEIDKLSQATSDLLDTAKSSVTANGRYDALKEAIGTAPEAGSVGKISISSIEAAINSIVPVLNEEIDKAKGIKNGVESFISGIGTSNILQGETWENVKTNMEAYSSLLDCNANAADFLSRIVKTAMGMITDYIQNAKGEIEAVGQTEYSSIATIDELDDTKLVTLKGYIAEMTVKINEQDAYIKAQEARPDECDKCEDGTYACNCRRPYSESDMKSWKDTLEKYKQIKEVLDKYQTVLEGFAPVVANAQKLINDAIEQVKTAYETPTTDMQGNQTFNSDFNLTLKDYGINEEKDYAKLIDDYYDKLNPKTTVEDILALDAQEPDPSGTSDVDNDSYLGNGGNPGYVPPAPEIPNTDIVPTEAITTPEEVTEPDTVVLPVEETTEGDTIPEEVIPTTPEQTEDEIIVEPEVTTEIEPTVVTDKGVEKISTNTGGGVNKKPKNPNVDPLTKPDQTVDTQENIVEDIIEDEPIIDDYQEPEIIENINVEEEVPEDEIIVSQTKENNGLKALGVAAGVGLAVGAAALGAHTMMKKNEEDDEYEDYGYEK